MSLVADHWQLSFAFFVFKVLHAGQVQRYAAASSEDAAPRTSPLVASLGALGCHGRYPSNIERDLFTHVARSFNNSATFPLGVCKVPVPHLNLDHHGLHVSDVLVLLPHELWAYIYEAKPSIWFLLFGSDAPRESFWQDVSAEISTHPHYD